MSNIDARGKIMNWIDGLGLVSALALGVYLMIALLKPEWFS